MPLLVAAIFFVLLVSPVVMLHTTRRKHQLERERILARRLGDSLTRQPGTPARIRESENVERLVERLGALPLIGGYLADTASQASEPMLRAIPALFVAGTIAFTHWLSLPAALLGGSAVAALPLVYLRRLRKRWLAMLAEQLPYLIDLLKAALESGHTMLRALQMAALNLPEPVSSELRLIVEQVQLGMTVPLALEAMYQRAPVEELGFLVAAVRIQSDVGSSLAEVFQHVSEGMRNRQRAEHQLRALTAQSRASAIIVTLLPFIVLAGLSLVNPSYSEPLFHNEAGIMMLKTAIVLDIIAFFVMRRIARVNF
jgi:tight adherence protein B